MLFIKSAAKVQKKTTNPLRRMSQWVGHMSHILAANDFL